MSDSELLILLKQPMTRSELVIKTGETDRAVRKRIQLLREKGYNIINRQDGKGYFLASDEETLKYARMRRKRAIAEFNAANLMEMRCIHKDGIEIPVKAHFRTIGYEQALKNQITMEDII